MFGTRTEAAVARFQRTFNLPGAYTRTFEAGSHQVAYTLEISDTVDGWAMLKISAPNEVESNQVTFSNGTGTLAFGAYQTLNLKTNGIVDTITVTMAVSGGSIGVVCPVLAIFSPET